MMEKNYMRRFNRGLTLVELMTVLFIIMLLAMVGFPTYQEYQNRANLAEAESVIGTMEKHLRTYFMDHGSFYSAAPNPSTVPGLASLGSSSTFIPSGGWTTIGSPIPSGSAVTFSYQAFAGQTPTGSTTPVTTSGFYNPTDDMNLIRRAATARNEYRFPQTIRVAKADEQLRFDWSDFNINACAATAIENCVTACTAAGIDVDQCNTSCQSSSDGRCDGAPEDPDCYTADAAATIDTSCAAACYNSSGDMGACTAQCNDGVSNGICTGSVDDPDCSSVSNTDLCNAGCTAVGGDTGSCSGSGACGGTPDGTCNASKGDPDCYGGSAGSGTTPDTTAQQNCEAFTTSQGQDPSKCSESDGSCSGTTDDQDCYVPTSSSQTNACLDGCVAATSEAERTRGCTARCSMSDGLCGSGNLASEQFADYDCYGGSSQSAAELCNTACLADNRRPEDCDASCSQSDGICSGGGSVDNPTIGDQDCYGSGNSNSGPTACEQRCMDAGTPQDQCTTVCNDEERACGAGGDVTLIWNVVSGTCDPASGGGGGGSSGGDAGGGSSGDSGGYYSGGGSSSGGDAGGGSSGGGGSTSSGSTGSVSSSTDECASFGINRPIDFGIQQNIAGYNWVVMTAVGNFMPGTTCTLAAKVIQVVNGQMSQSGDFIKINLGE